MAMTKKEIYKAIIDMANGKSIDDTTRAEIITRMDKDIAIADFKSASYTSAPNEALNKLKTDILTVLNKAGSALSIAQIINALNAGSPYQYGKDSKPLNSQIITSAMITLGDGTDTREGEHLVVKTFKKRVAYFEIAPAVAVEVEPTPAP